jgi:hypothetical protein
MLLAGPDNFDEHVNSIKQNLKLSSSRNLAIVITSELASRSGPFPVIRHPVVEVFCFTMAFLELVTSIPAMP